MLSNTPIFPSNTHLIYWDAIIDLVNVDTDNYRNAVKKLSIAEYKNADLSLKNVTGHYRLYGIRLNDADRVLGTTFNSNGKSYLLLLELVNNHDYQKAHFMKDGVLDRYMKTHLSALQDFIKKQEINLLNENNPVSSNSYKAVKLYENKIISLSGEQQSVLDEQKKGRVLLISGGPGSGKSVVALSLLKQELGKNNGIEEGETLLYLTQSKYLSSKMQSIWSEEAEPNPYNKIVLFKTYNELIKEYWQIEDEDFAEREHFNLWLKNYLKKIINKNNSTLKELNIQSGQLEMKTLELIYQEFRIISGYDLELYFPQNNNISTIQSLFPSINQRKWLYTAYCEYQAILKQESKIHPAFSTIPNMKKYHVIVVDEAQDFSLLQLKIIYQARIDNNIYFFNDPNQTLDDNLSKTTFLTHLCNQRNLSLISLSGSYRFPLEIMRLANAVMDLKLRLTGGLTDKRDQTQLTQSQEQEAYQLQASNCLQWFENIEEISNKTDLIEKIKRSADIAIITLETYKEEAKKLFNTISVFTAEEIKGLEFPFIIAYRLLDDEPYFLANNILRNKKPTNTPQNLPKKGKEDYQYGPPFNRLYTALTRPTAFLVIVQESAHHVEEIISYLKSKTIPLTPSPLSSVNLNELIADTEETWLNKAKIAFTNGNVTYAEAIFFMQLKKTNEDFIQWKNQFNDTASDLNFSIPIPKQEHAELAEKKSNSISTSQQKKNQVTSQSSKAIQTAIDKKNHQALKKLISKALDDCDPMSLIHLISKKNGAELFLMLCDDKKFIAQIKQKPYFIEALCTQNNKSLSMLYWLLSTEKGRQLFFTLYNEAELVKKLISSSEFPLTLISLNQQTTNPNYNTSALSWLLSVNKGITLLDLLSKNEYFLTSLSTQPYFIPTLLAVPKQENNIVHDSILVWLISDAVGQKIFALLTRNETFWAALCTSAPFFTAILARQTSGEKENTSVLYYLISAPSNFKIFIDLCHNKVFFETLCNHEDFIDTLLSLRPPSAKAEQNTSALYYLLSNTQGMRLFTLLCQNDDFLLKLQINKRFIPTLLSQCTHSEGKYKNLSPLYWLITTSNGYKLMAQLCNNNKFFADLCTQEELINIIVARGSQYVFTDENSSLLYYLCGNQEARKIFSLFCANKIFLKNLCEHKNFIPTLVVRFNKLAGAAENNSALYWLIIHSEGWLIFTHLCQNHSFLTHLLASEEFISTLLARRNNQAEQETNVSVLYYLTATSPGCRLLATFCDNEDFLKKLYSHPDFIPTLLARRNHLAPINANTSALFFLLCSPEGQTIFSRLCEKHNFLVQLQTNNDFISTLLALHPPKSTSILYLLLMVNPPKFKIFTDLCKNETFFTNLCTHEDFINTIVTICSQPTKCHQNSSALLWLLSYPENFDLFTNLCKNETFFTRLCTHKEFITALLARRPATSEEYENTSPLWQWIRSAKKLDLFARFCENETFLTNLFMHKEFLNTLLARLNERAHLFKNTSVLYYLIVSKIFIKWCKKEDFLERLSAHNDFITILLTRINYLETEDQTDISLLYILLKSHEGREIFSRLCTNDHFVKHLVTHDGFNRTIYDPVNIKCRYAISMFQEAHDDRLEQGHIFIYLSNSTLEFKTIDLNGEIVNSLTTDFIASQPFNIVMIQEHLVSFLNTLELTPKVESIVSILKYFAPENKILTERSSNSIINSQHHFFTAYGMLRDDAPSHDDCSKTL